MSLFNSIIGSILYLVSGSKDTDDTTVPITGDKDASTSIESTQGGIKNTCPVVDEGCTCQDVSSSAMDTEGTEQQMDTVEEPLDDDFVEGIKSAMIHTKEELMRLKRTIDATSDEPAGVNPWPVAPKTCWTPYPDYEEIDGSKSPVLSAADSDEGFQGYEEEVVECNEDIFDSGFREDNGELEAAHEHCFDGNQGLFEDLDITDIDSSTTEPGVVTHTIIEQAADHEDVQDDDEVKPFSAASSASLQSDDFNRKSVSMGSSVSMASEV